MNTVILHTQGIFDLVFSHWFLLAQWMIVDLIFGTQFLMSINVWIVPDLLYKYTKLCC